jgi:hypothetical protein
MKPGILRAIKYSLFIAVTVMCGWRCAKSTTGTNATMSATVNGSNITFNTTVTLSNGYTVVTGNGSSYSITLVLKTVGSGLYYLGAQSTGYYATVTDNFGNSYSTDAANTGQITISKSGANYSATFYFIANETSPIAGGGNVNVTNGSCTNI